jgi:hypothetical protein
MGNPEDKNGGYESAETEQKVQEARFKKADKLPEETQTAFKKAIDEIKDLALLVLAKKYLEVVANMNNKDKLGAYMKNFMERNNIAEDAKALELIKTINACLFLDDKHGDRVADMTTFLSRREIELQVQKTTNN